MDYHRLDLPADCRGCPQSAFDPILTAKTVATIILLMAGIYALLLVTP